MIVFVLHPLSFLSRGPTHSPSRQQMKMQMENRLSRIRARVCHNTIAAQIIFLRDFARHAQAFARRQGGSVVNDFVHGREVLVWNNENVGWRLRIQIGKSRDMIRLENNVSRYFTRDNFAKDTISHVRWKRVRPARHLEHFPLGASAKCGCPNCCCCVW